MGLEDIFKVTESQRALAKTAQNNPYFDVLLHRVHFPKTGSPPADFLTIEYRFYACAAVCLDSQGRVPLVRIPRFPHRNTPGDEWFWELPGGRNQGTESPTECIERELREEAGLVAETFTPLLKDYFYPESSFGTEKLYLFLASNVRRLAEPVSDSEGTVQLRWFDLEEAVEMVFQGEIRSSWSIIGLLATKIRVASAK